MITLALLLMILLAGMVALVLGMAKKPEIAIIPILASEVFATRYTLPSISVGSLTIFATDLPTIALIVATLLRPYFGVRRRTISKPVLAIFLLAALGLLRGSRAFGLQIAGNNAREILGFAITALFFSTVSITPAFVEALRRWFLLASVFIVTVAVIFWLQNGFGEFSTVGQRGMRGIDALVVQIATITAIVIPYGRTRTRHVIIPAIGFIVIVLSLQRSVAVSSFVALAVIVFFGGRRRTRRSSRVTRVLLLVGGVAIGLLILAGPTGLTSDLNTAVETSTAQTGTFNWRLEGWRILVKDQLAGPLRDIVLGQPTGSGSARIIGDTLVTVAPHSMYVSLFESVGLIGLGIMLWFLASMFRRNVVNVRSEYEFTAMSGLLFTTLLAAMATYFITYSDAYIAGLVIGLSASLAWNGAVDPEIIALEESEPTPPAAPARHRLAESTRRRVEPTPDDLFPIDRTLRL